MTVEDKIDDKELKDINPQRDDYEDEIIQIIKSDEPDIIVRRFRNLTGIRSIWMISRRRNFII